MRWVLRRTVWRWQKCGEVVGNAGGALLVWVESLLAHAMYAMKKVRAVSKCGRFVHRIAE